MNDHPYNLRFPILGICLGFEALITLPNNYIVLPTRCDVKDEYCPLSITEAGKNSLMYSHSVEYESIMENLEKGNLTANNHT